MFHHGLLGAALVLASAPGARAQDASASRTVTGPATFTVSAGGTMTPYGRFVTITNTGTTPVVNPRITANGKNWRSAADIVAGVVQPGMTDEQKARALWTFARENRYHWGPPTAGIDARDAVKLFNTYGYGFCSDVADALAALWEHAGLRTRQWNLGAMEHSVSEVFYDGKWHLLDADLEGLYLSRDNQALASVEDIIADPGLLARAGPNHDRLRDIYATTPGGRVFTQFTPASPMDFTLRPQEELSLSWTPFGTYHDDSGTGAPPPPIYANGTLTSPFRPGTAGARSQLARSINLRLSAEDGLAPGASPATVAANGDLVYRISSPYVIVGARLEGRFRKGNPADVIEIATARNGGRLKRDWNELANGRFAVDGFPMTVSGLAGYTAHGLGSAAHAEAVGTPGTLTYRMRPLPDVQGNMPASALVYRATVEDDVRLLVSQDGATWQTAWVAQGFGHSTMQVNLAPLVAGWTSFYVRLSFTSGSWVGSAGLESLDIQGVDPFAYRPAWSAAATGQFNQTIDLTPTTAWFGSTPLYEYLVRIRMRSDVSPTSVGVDDFTITTIVQVAPWSLPALRLGANEIQYTDDSTGTRQVRLSQGWTERTDGRAPTAPASAIYPANDSHIAAGPTVPFAWQRSTNPSGAAIYRYQLWICDSAACTSPLATGMEFFLHNTPVGDDGIFASGDDGPTIAPLATLQAPIGSLLAQGQRYYWRVRAQDRTLEWSPWSPTWSFVVDQTAAAPTAGPQVTITGPTGLSSMATADATLNITGTASSPAGVASVRWFTDAGASGTATGQTAWSANAVPLPARDSVLSVVVTDTAGRTAIDSVTVVRSAAMTEYLLPEGATGDFFDLDIVVANPTDRTAQADAQFLVEGGATHVMPLTIAPFSRQRVRVDAVEGIGEAAVATAVASASGAPLVVERTSSWDAEGYGGSGASAVPAPATRWLFAEGAQGYFDTYLLLANTSGSAASVTVSFFLEGGGRVDRSYAVLPSNRVTVYAGAIPELVDRSFAFEVRSDVPITCERATYFGTRRMWDGGHSATGTTAPALRWFHAEGATGPFFDTFVTVGNPSATTANLTVTYLTQEGPPIVRHHALPGEERLTLAIDVQDPALADAAVATIVESDVPVVSERVSYWGSSGWSEGSSTLGSTQARTRWGVADIRLGGPRGHQTYILLANPDATQAANVTVRFFGAEGQLVTRQYVVPPGRRWNVQVGADAPELDGREVSARIESSNGVPIFVVRSMFWNAAGEVWAAGASVLGTPLP